MRVDLPSRSRGARSPFSRLDWSLEMLVLLLIGAEAAVASLLLTALFGSLGMGSEAIWPGWIFLLLLLGTNIQRAMEGYRFFSPQYEFLSIAAVVMLLVVAVRVIIFPARGPLDSAWPRDAAHALAFPSDPLALPMWSTIIFVAYAWWRGRSRDDPSLEAAYRTLRVGTPLAIVAILGTMAITAVDEDRGFRTLLYGGTIGFLLLTLAAIALGRLRIEQARGALTLTPRWLLTFLGPVVGLVLVGTLIAGIFTRRFLDTILWLLTPVFWLVDLLLLLFVYIATGFAYVIFAIITFFLNLFGPVEPAPRPTQGIPGTPTTDPTAGITAIHYPDSLRYLFVLATLAGLIFVLTRFLWHRRPRRQVAAGEERESVFSWDLLAEGAAGLLAGLGGRFRRAPDPLAGLRGDPRWQHTVTIRELYGKLLKRGEGAERPRADAQTPDEYVPIVGATAPLRPVGTLTARYDTARYSEQPATAEEADAARRAWEEIERVPLSKPKLEKER
ncbi:MAG TPA: DUF4129 domain-containing protein [Thermomicrobiales bacterium]|jgi:hypothetical protein